MLLNGETDTSQSKDQNRGLRKASHLLASSTMSQSKDPPTLNYRDLQKAAQLQTKAGSKLRKGEIDASFVVYTKAIKCLTGREHTSESKRLLAEIYSNRAVTFYRKKDYASSLVDCEQALDLDPRAEQTYVRKSIALNASENFKMAFACLKKGLSVLPNSIMIKDQFRAIPKCIQKRAMAKILVDKDPCAAHKIYIGAIAGALDASRATSGNEVVRLCLASLYAGRGLLCYLNKVFSACIRDCDLSIELDNSQLNVYLRKARALKAIKNFDGAIRTLQASKQNSKGTPYEIRSREKLLRGLTTMSGVEK